MKKQSPPKFTVWLEAEHWAEGEWTPFDDNADVVVMLEDGSSGLLPSFRMPTSAH